MKKVFLSFVTLLSLIPCIAQTEQQNNQRPESGCAGNPIPVLILTQPASQSVCPGRSVLFTSYALMVERRIWEMSTDNGITWYPSIGQLSSAIDGNTYYDTLTIPIVYQEMSGYMFRCSYNSVCGNLTYRTLVAVLTVAENPVQIISQPINAVSCIGNTADFSIGIAGGSLSYQWQESADGGSSFLNMTGKNTANLHFESVNAALNNYQYRCIVNSECGGTVISNAAVLSVNNGNTVITLQPQNTLLCDGDTAFFSTTASGDNIAYQWQQRTYPAATFTDINGEISSTLAIPNIPEGVYYRCKINSNCGTVFSQEAYAFYRIDPEFHEEAIKFACEGDIIYLSGIATNDPQTYQWMVSTDSGVTYSTIQGETSAQIAITASSLNNGFRYKCHVSNPCYSGYSNTTALYSNPVQISIPYQPQDQNACVGTPTYLFLYGSGPVENYVWEISYDGGASFTNIPFADNIHSGASTPVLNIIPAATGVYYYRCKLYGRCSPAIYSRVITFSVFSKPNVASDTSLYVSCDTCTLNILNAFDTTGFRNVDLYAVTNNLSMGITAVNPDSVDAGRYRLIVENEAGCKAISYIHIGIRKFDTLKVCPGTAATFTSPLPGASYQWQINRGNGNGFEDITDFTAGISYDYVYGSLTNTLNIHEVRAPSLVRCKVNGNSYSNTFFISVLAYWTGAVSNAWEDPANWSCGVPAYFSDVYIPADVPRLPQINSNNIYCRSLTVAKGASVTIKSGMNVYVNDYFQY